MSITNQTTRHVTKDVLLVARALINTYGHYQGGDIPDPYNEILTRPHAQRPMSIMAAIDTAAGSLPGYRCELGDHVIRSVAAHIGFSPQISAHAARALVRSWNDLPGRTRDEVLELLASVALELDRP